MKAWEFDAVCCRGSVLCNDCVPEDADQDELDPIFASSEWEYVPVCAACGAEHDYVTLIERPTVTCSSCGEDFLDRDTIPLGAGGNLCNECAEPSTEKEKPQ